MPQVPLSIASLFRCASALAVATYLLSSSVLADGPPGYGPVQTESGTDYDSAAREAYGMGYASIERATRLDHDAAAATEERVRHTALNDAAIAYEDALSAFEDAVKLEPEMYEAHTYIGYANRKLGRYDRSLAAYETALRLKPDYARAIEYQGEAYLALDRFDAAKFNYLRLYAVDAQQAEKLLMAMRAWAAERQREPRALSKDAISAAAAWLATRPSTARSARTSEATPW